MTDKTRLVDGKIVIYKRGGTYHATYRIDGKYIRKTLKTGNLQVAMSSAQQAYSLMLAKQELGVPLNNKKISDVIAEYIAFREKDHNLGGRTKIENLRQIKRVSKFWIEYCGNNYITSVNNATMRDFIQWRKEYYHRIKPENRPRNYKLNPTDKTLQWEFNFMKTLLKWSYDRGYMGTIQLPTETFTIKKIISRPAFDDNEIEYLKTSLIKNEYTALNDKFAYSRRLLSDYVMILLYSGMRVGEANNLKMRDIVLMNDDYGRMNYSINVKIGKTGERQLIPNTDIVGYIERRFEQAKKKGKNDYLFQMYDGRKVLNLIDQFDALLNLIKLKKSSNDKRFSLYSLRHTYAVNALRDGIAVWDIARNMGTSVEQIHRYYGRQATPIKNATRLGGRRRIVDEDGKWKYEKGE